MECGSWTTARMDGLGKPCSRHPTYAGRAALKRLQQGMHPTCDLRVEGLWSLAQCLEVEHHDKDLDAPPKLEA